MIKSDSIAKLAGALAKCQGAIEGAKKDSANPFFKSTYADLESCWQACRTQLAENELAVIQTSDETDKGAIIETLLTHSSGEYIGGRMFIPLSKIDAQTVGSAITYARRYSLMAIVGLAPTDDDGNGAVEGAKGKKDDKKPQDAKQESAGEAKPTAAVTLSAEQEKYFPRIKAALDTIYGTSIELKKSKIKELTTFPEKKDGVETGKTIQGVEDYRKLDGKRLQILCHDLEKLTPKQETADICNECRQPMINGACRNLNCPEGREE